MKQALQFEPPFQPSHIPVHSHIVIGIPCLLLGGTERQTLMVVRALLAKRGSCPSSVMRCEGNAEGIAYRITVVCYFEHNEEMVDEFRSEGADVRLLGLSRGISPISLILKLRTVFSTLKPDILHIQYMAPGLLPIVAGRLAGIRNMIATIHQPATPYGLMPRLFLRLGARLCRRFVCVSHATEESWFGVKKGPKSLEENVGNAERETRTAEASARAAEESPVEPAEKHLTIHNAVDMEAIDRIRAATDEATLRHELGLQGAVVVGTVARLSHEKGVDLLIRAFAHFHEQFPTARLLVVGDGPERASLTQLARDLRLENHLVWAGAKPWGKAMQLLSLMDVVVVPSRYEGFGLTAAEAMAFAKPVVAFNLEGLAEVLGSETPGQLVRQNETQALSTSVAAFVESGALRDKAGQNNRDRVATRFSLNLFSSHWLSQYSSLLTAHPLP